MFTFLNKYNVGSKNIPAYKKKHTGIAENCCIQNNSKIVLECWLLIKHFCGYSEQN